MSDLLRVYDPADDAFMPDGYPYAWKTIKHLVREEAGHRCVRCGHPYRNGAHGNGEWSPCDIECQHFGPFRWLVNGEWLTEDDESGDHWRISDVREAQWRILTVHHLNGDKADCRWWNLASLCQRCHLTIQGKVFMDRPWRDEHSEWFKPYAAGFYASKYLGLDLSREETLPRLDELLALEHAYTTQRLW